MLYLENYLKFNTHQALHLRAIIAKSPKKLKAQLFQNGQFQGSLIAFVALILCSKIGGKQSGQPVHLEDIVAMKIALSKTILYESRVIKPFHAFYTCS